MRDVLADVVEVVLIRVLLIVMGVADFVGATKVKECLFLCVGRD